MESLSKERRKKMSEADIQVIRRSLLQSNPPIRNEESDFERALQLSLQEAHATAKRKEEEKKIKQLVHTKNAGKGKKKDAFMTYQNYGSKNGRLLYSPDKSKNTSLCANDVRIVSTRTTRS